MRPEAVQPLTGGEDGDQTPPVLAHQGRPVVLHHPALLVPDNLKVLRQDTFKMKVKQENPDRVSKAN